MQPANNARVWNLRTVTTTTCRREKIRTAFRNCISFEKKIEYNNLRLSEDNETDKLSFVIEFLFLYLISA